MEDLDKKISKNILKKFANSKYGCIFTSQTTTMTLTLNSIISKMTKVSKREFDQMFKNVKGVDKKYYYTDEGNRIYAQKGSRGKDVAVYLYEENEYYILKN